MRAIRVATLVAAIAVTLAGCVAEESASEDRGNDGFTPSVTPSTEEPVEDAPASETGTATEGECGFQANGELVVGLPPDQGPVTATTLALTTSAGQITIQLDAERGPCTVQSIVYLASAGYYNETPCHRLTASEGLKVLQCGDREGTGSGSPGYVVPDEPVTGLAAGPPATDGTETVIYPRGIVAMANGSRPGTTGSQFFLVYGDSTLPPSYNIVGTIDEVGLTTLDQIAAGGITPVSSTEDGAPATPVTITSAVAA